MFDSIENFKPTDTYYIKVDMQAVYTYTTESGMEFYHPNNAGDTYQNKPFHGELVAAPKGSKIPIGATVYLNYLASESLFKIGDENYYVVKKDMLVAYDVEGERKAYESILISVIEEDNESKLTFDLSEDEHMDAVINGSQKAKKPTTCAEVIVADNEWLEKNYGFTVEPGDILEYEKSLDWGYIVNRTEHFYIKWANRIIRKNDEMVNRYNEIVPISKYIERNGLVLLNTERFTVVVDGEFKGKKILPEVRRIETKKYIKSDFIYGHLE